jgi:hypothetical protein
MFFLLLNAGALFFYAFALQHLQSIPTRVGFGGFG